MTHTQILTQLHREALEKEWPFPKLFEALKNAQVTSYEVIVESGHRTSKGSFGVCQDMVLPDFQTLTTQDHFDEKAVIHALGRRQRKETTYRGFLCDIAMAGVKHYLVDMAQRKVRYWGKDEGDCYIQNIPQI